MIDSYRLEFSFVAAAFRPPAVAFHSNHRASKIVAAPPKYHSPRAAAAVVTASAPGVPANAVKKFILTVANSEAGNRAAYRSSACKPASRAHSKNIGSSTKY